VRDLLHQHESTLRKLLRACLGFNGASIIRGARYGVRELARACIRSNAAARPFEIESERDLREFPQQSLESILAGQRAEIKLPVMEYEDGMLPTHDALALLAILVCENPKTVLEIGTYMGHTTRAMAQNLTAGTIHTVDLPPGFFPESDAAARLPKDDFHLIGKRVVGREFKDTPYVKQIIQHHGDTAEFDFHKFGQPSFFFIDGSHTYEYCRNDSERCLEISAPGSVFLWHDCDAVHPGVIKLLEEWRALGRDVVRIFGTALAYWKRSDPNSL
jgi:hypothetical protein